MVFCFKSANGGMFVHDTDSVGSDVRLLHDTKSTAIVRRDTKRTPSSTVTLSDFMSKERYVSPLCRQRKDF